MLASATSIQKADGVRIQTIVPASAPELPSNRHRELNLVFLFLVIAHLPDVIESLLHAALVPLLKWI